MRTVILIGGALGIAVACSEPPSQIVYGCNGPPRIAVAKVELRPNQVSLVVNASTQLVAMPEYQSGNALGGRTFQWSSSNNTIATVSDSALSKLSTPAVRLSWPTSEDVSGTAALVVSNPPPARVASATARLTSSSLTVGQSTQTGVTLKDASGITLTGRTVTYASSNPASPRSRARAPRVPWPRGPR